MRLKLIFSFLLCVVIFSLNAQVKSNDVLFTVDDDPVLATEFLRVYNKNLDLVKDESQKDIDEYLKLFVNYALKIKEAKALEYDKKPQYIREFESYRKQLAKNYLTDSNVTNELVRQAYDRISQDVKASHILIKLAESETDTAQVYQQMLAFRERLINDDFETIKSEAHNGQTVFVEDLGYFSAFKMVYDFENVAYNTPVGEVSQPFRTQFGFHVLKVYDKRPSRGEVTVGHIMLTNNKKDSLSDPKTRIQEIYKLIQQGEKFETLAKQYSDDQSSAKNGGKLTPFKSGQLRSVKFEDKAFSMKEIDEISEPFETDYGWHIMKLYAKSPIEPFDKMKGQLESQVKRDGRSKIINKAFIKTLKAKYNVSDDVDLDYFVSIMNDTYFSRTWTLPDDLPKEKPLLKIDRQQLDYNDFALFLEKKQKSIREKQSFEGVVKSQFDEFLDEKILKYHEDNLENDNKEYAQILTEYRDGLLLFDLMETKIWNAVKQDSAGIEDYFNANKSNYMWPERMDAVVISGSKKVVIEDAKRQLQKGVDVETLKESINKNEQNAIFTSGLMTTTDRSVPKDFDVKLGVSDVYNEGDSFSVVIVKEIVPATNKTLDESRGKVISDYQVTVENQWLQSLKDKYKVKINAEVLNKIKSQINK